jgi:hypothetical protein
MKEMLRCARRTLAPEEIPLRCARGTLAPEEIFSVLLGRDRLE